LRKHFLIVIAEHSEKITEIYGEVESGKLKVSREAERILYMSIAKKGNKYIPTCDICEDTLDAEPSYDDAIDAMLMEGWESNIFRVEGQPDILQNKCCNCQDYEESGVEYYD